MKKILLLNGPPRSGKDTIAEYLKFRGWHHGKFSKVLKERCHALYGFPDRPYDYYEDCKDEPNDDFFGLDPRQAYIHLSEKLMKIIHGDDIWVRMFAKEIEGIKEDYIVVSDLGFQVEWETLIDIFGYDKLSLVMLYRDGCNFNNDSRDYVRPRGPWEYISAPNDGFAKYITNNCFDVENGGTIDDLHQKACYISTSVIHNREQKITGRGKAIGEVANQKVG